MRVQISFTRAEIELLHAATGDLRERVLDDLNTGYSASRAEYDLAGELQERFAEIKSRRGR